MTRRRAGFGLLEVMFAITIVAVALVGLQATVNGAILTSGDSVNRRAGRELARSKMEEILARASLGDTGQAEGGGEFDDFPEFRWSSKVEDVDVGPEGQTESIKLVHLQVSFPVIAGEADDGGESRETVKLDAVLPEPAPTANAAPAGAPR